MSQVSQNSRIFTPDLKDWMDRRKRELRSEMNCMSIGTIKAFDAATQTATIQVNFLRVIQGFSPLASPLLDLATDYKLNYPLLVNCPVMFLSGGDARLTFPVAVGDTCIILFADKDIDTWYSTGQINVPNSSRTHDLNDAIAIVGVRSAINKLSDYSATDLELKFPTGKINIIDRTGERLAQSGFLQPYAGSTAPSGWLLCYGQSISKTTYPDLFAVIGYTFGGSGDNFNVPDYRGRNFVGLDNMGGSSADVLTAAFTPNRNTLGGAIGEQVHLLTGRESGIQLHSHTVPLSVGGGGGSGGPWAQKTDNVVTATVNTGNAGNTDALDPHYNVQPGRMCNVLIKI